MAHNQGVRYLVFTLAVAAYLLSLVWILDLAWLMLTGETPRRLVQLSRLRGQPR